MVAPTHTPSYRRRMSVAVAITCLAGSVAFNVGAVTLSTELLRPVPFEMPEREELLVVDLTEQPAPKPEPLPEPEREQEEKPEPPRPKTPEPRPKELLAAEPEALPEPPPPEPEPEPEPQEQPPPPPEMPPNMKMVEQLDEHDEKEVPENYEYLSNVNRDVLEQTRAKMTNLIEDAEKAKAQQLEPTESTEQGNADEQEIAQEEKNESRLDRQAPNETPKKEDLRPEQQDPEPESLLAMREVAPRDHSEAMVEQPELALEAEDGALAAKQDQSASIAKRDQQAKQNRKDNKYQFRLSHRDMDAAFGKDLAAKRDIISKQQSKQKGVWDDARARYVSPLENMVPEVKVGNQTALRSRKHPFARYIATMHRGIHELWAYGFLEQLDTRSGSHPLNDHGLWTRLEIVINPNGTIDSVKVVHHSGNSSFDAAAREIVYAAGPFPDPPSEIKSGNGKIYMHWAFHRNERACGTFGAQPFILNNAGQGDVPDAHSEVQMGARGGGAGHQGHAHGTGSGGGDARRLSRESGMGGGGTHIAQGTAGASGTSGSAGTAGRGGTAGREGPPPPPGAGAGPRPSASAGEQGSPGTAGSAGTAGTGVAAAGINLSPRTAVRPTVRAPAAPVEANDAKARETATGWARAFGKGQVSSMVHRSSVPFRSGMTVAARNAEELEGLLSALSEEAGTGSAKIQGVYTAAGLRKHFGSVPGGVEEGEGKLYAVAKLGGDTFILMLEKRFTRWRVVGLTR